MAEIKVNDNSEWETRLFNCNTAQFRAMANRRFVAIGKQIEIPVEALINMLRKNIGWDK
jgi:hypothetical protein